MLPRAVQHLVAWSTFGHENSPYYLEIRDENILLTIGGFHDTRGFSLTEIKKDL